jgi:uncharacterized coiled-coil DUF342 family protein
MQALIVKLLINAIIKALNKKLNLKNIKEYVEEDNELDIKVRSLFEKRAEDLMKLNSIQKSINKYGKYIEEIEKDIANVKAVAHEPVDWLNKIKGLEKEVKVLKDIVSNSESIKNKFKKIKL